MNKTVLMIVGLLLAVALGTFVPQIITENAESSQDEVSYRFVNLGLTTPEARKQVRNILEQVVGISDISIHPTADLMVITFDQESMKAEWISKVLDSHGFSPDSYHKVKQ